MQIRAIFEMTEDFAPELAVPLEEQFEQFLNARYLSHEVKFRTQPDG